MNVGGFKSQVIDTDFWARLGWNIDEFGPESQPVFLKKFAEESCGRENADEISSILAEFFRLCFIRKPDTMGSALCVTRPHIIRSVWAAALPSEFADLLLRQYQSLLDRAEKVAQKLPEEARAAYFELVLYPVRMLSASGSTFINYERYLHSSADPTKSREYADAVKRWNRMIVENTDDYNNRLEGGKWKHMMTVGGGDSGFSALYKLPNIDSTAAEQIPTATVAEQTKWSAAAEFPRARFWERHSFPESSMSPRCAGRRLKAWVGAAGLWRGRRWLRLTAGRRPAIWGALPGWNTISASMTRLRTSVSACTSCLPFSSIRRCRCGWRQAWIRACRNCWRCPQSLSDNNKTGNRDQTEMANRVTVEFPFSANGRNSRTVKIWTPDPGVVLDQIEIRVRK